jgi:hypothetical protein
MLHVSPWEAAADCERAAQHQSNNPEYWAVYTHLRDLWIALANTRSLLSESEFEHEVENIIRIEVEMTHLDSGYLCYRPTRSSKLWP